MFDTDLTREYEAAEGLGLDPRDSYYDTAIDGALCDDETKARLRARDLLPDGLSLPEPSG